MKVKEVFLPKNKLSQKLNRDNLSNYNKMIKEEVDLCFNKNNQEFVIQDGPPYANGELHVGHLLNKTLKDFYIKYYLKNGYKVFVRFGWDCHGLPIENRAKNMPGNLLENCKQIAESYSQIQKNTLSLFGIYSTDKDYLTLSDDFVKRELNIFNKLKESGYVFKKNKPTWYSPSLNTVLANSEIEYQDIEDKSLFFTFKIDENLSLLVWTTTEWTIYGNQAVCLNPNVVYVKTKDGLICSQFCAKSRGWEYEVYDTNNLKSYFNHKNEVCPVLFDNFVSEENTGIVHLSGGHGEDDYNVLVNNNIIPKNVVEDLFELQKHIEYFKIDERFLFEEKYFKHSYPVDWRTKQKVVKVLTEQTYIDFDWNKIKSTSKQIKLSGKDRTRLESMLFSRKDWCVSRQRQWGVNIPGEKDILDVWFDSGTVFSMYDYPADLYIEGIDQFRGWFQSSIIIASMIDRVPTKRILSHGFVVNENENKELEKLSKSKGNYNSLIELYERYNPDVLRVWVFLSDYKNDVILSDSAFDNAGKQYFKLRNFTRYLVNNIHRDVHDYNLVREDLKNEVKILKQKIEENVNLFELRKAILDITVFINKYSSWLTEDMKNEFYESELNGEIRIKLENEFLYLANELKDILFPFVPFLSVELNESIKNIYNESIIP